ncbi:shikimate dehydrogenase [Alkaliphilus sp. B6464]|uniref:shikimate dehydrogenase n=1 Tax=Alkaliphilus sp. B6464 TaxID=2731219 RepID=UPI001BA51D20|nr:shikimate dehydrogenase [Alkaliphilus sp. B6464]QUH18908.1 shikimate dehydrogenase [Alkaliphilus sp. B6464]
MNRFAFLIHPIEIDDIYRKYKYLKILPKMMTEKVVSNVSPSVISKITDIKSESQEAEGWFIGVPLTSSMMMNMQYKYVLKRIIDSGRIAEKLGARIIGLGAYTSVVGDAGVTVAKNLNIAVTTGNTYTVAAAFEATRNACNLLGKNLQESEVAIVGATGSIGKVCAELACREAKKVILVGRNIQRLIGIKLEFHQKYGYRVEVECCTNVSDGIENADVVITVTSSVDDVIKAEYIKSGAVVCDVARPRDVSKLVQEKRKDVLVIEGGVIEVPKEVNFNFNFGFPEGLCYACMAETMILALEGKYENFSLGREMQIEKVDEINKLAEKHGFKVAGLRSFEKVIDEKYIESVIENMKKVHNI